jgi:hypothetical protein
VAEVMIRDRAYIEAIRFTTRVEWDRASMWLWRRLFARASKR